MTDEEKTAEPDVTAQELREALCIPPPTFCGEALQFAMEHPDLGRDVSLGILGEAYVAVEEGWLDEELEFAPVYASCLLAYHREELAFDLLSAFARLPDGGEEVFGDFITEELPGVLWSVCGDSVEPLLSIVDHTDSNPYWCASALNAIAIGVAEGVLDREEMLRIISQRMEAMIEAGPPWSDQQIQTASWIGNEMVDLGIAQEPSLLDRAHDLGLLDWLILRPEDWHEQAPRTHDECLLEIRRRRGWLYPVDPMKLRRWACFEESKTVSARAMAMGQKKKSPRPSQRVKSKTKSKASRKSRKKNRRKK